MLAQTLTKIAKQSRGETMQGIQLNPKVRKTSSPLPCNPTASGEVRRSMAGQCHVGHNWGEAVTISKRWGGCHLLLACMSVSAVGMEGGRALHNREGLARRATGSEGCRIGVAQWLERQGWGRGTGKGGGARAVEDKRVGGMRVNEKGHGVRPGGGGEGERGGRGVSPASCKDGPLGSGFAVCCSDWRGVSKTSSPTTAVSYFVSLTTMSLASSTTCNALLLPHNNTTMMHSVYKWI